MPAALGASPAVADVAESAPAPSSLTVVGVSLVSLAIVPGRLSLRRLPHELWQWNRSMPRRTDRSTDRSTAGNTRPEEGSARCSPLTGEIEQTGQAGAQLGGVAGQRDAGVAGDGGAERTTGRGGNGALGQQRLREGDAIEVGGGTAGGVRDIHQQIEGAVGRGGAQAALAQQIEREIAVGAIDVAHG